MQRRFLRAVVRNASSPIFRLSPMVQNFPASFPPEAVVPELEWPSPQTCVEAARQAGAAAVWLGGTEPLFHPAIGEVTSTLAGAGYYVFLHTSGVDLRKRIHEFKPVDRLYLTLEIPMNDALDPQRQSPMGQGVSLAAVSEALRVARLSGFHLCAHFTATDRTSPAAVSACLQAIQQHLDGMVVSSSGAAATNSPLAADSLAAIAKLIPSAGWRSFSSLVEASYQQTQRSFAPAFVPRPSDDEPSAQSACGESA